MSKTLDVMPLVERPNIRKEFELWWMLGKRSETEEFMEFLEENAASQIDILFSWVTGNGMHITREEVFSLWADWIEACADGYIYLLCAGPWCKIGKSVNPHQRIHTLLTQPPFPTEILKVWPSNCYSVAENYLHGFFGELRVRGEWFTLRAEHIERLLAYETMNDYVLKDIDLFVYGSLGQWGGE